MINPIFDSFKEYEYNLKIFENTLKKGIPLDEKFEGYIKIFRDQLGILANDPSVFDKLPELLNRIDQAEELLKVNIQTFTVVKTPLMGEEKPLSNLAESYVQGAVKAGIEALDPDFTYRSIRGDGHCLFRSIAAGLLIKFETTSKEEKQNYLIELEARLKKYVPTFSNDKFKFLKGILTLIENKDMNISDLMNSQDLSDELVLILREISVGYQRELIKRRPDSEMKYSLEEAGEGDIETYFSNMTDLKKATLGGDLELFSLSRSLGININVLNTQAIGQGQDKNNIHNQFGHQGRPSIHLLFRPGHYDLALKK